MRTLYMDCSSGISGDMTAAALLDAGADRDGLQRMLETMPLEGFHVEIGRTEKCGISACDFDVVEDVHHHVHRHLKDIYEIIDGTKASGQVKDLAKDMFRVVAEAEAKAHQVPVEKVHFHEVGAVDSIVDLMSAAYLAESLQIDRVVISELSEGTGYVKCQHGVLPVPVPAVVNILEAKKLPVRLTETKGEMITPTGAAIAAALREKYGREETGGGLPRGKLLQIGIGAGKKDFSHANILRVMIFEECTDGQGTDGEKLWMLETNLDDCTGETLGYVSEKLMEAGAKDVTFTPIYMKKNRPAYLLGILCGEEKREELETLVFLHTTTIGIRRYPVERSVLERKHVEIETSYGAVHVKQIVRPSGIVRVPEYESVREICERTGESFACVYKNIEREAAQ